MPTLEDARSKLPLDALLNQYGYGVPMNGKRGGFKCPFCEKKCAYLRGGPGQQFFKCHNDSCPSATSAPKGAWDQVRFIGWKHSLSTTGATGQYSEASIHFMKEAGVWKERDQLSPTLMPGGQRRKKPLPKPPISEVDVENMPVAPAPMPADVAEALNVLASDPEKIAATNGVIAESASAEVNAPAASVEITGIPAGVAIPEPPAAVVKVKEKDPTGLLALREFYAALPALIDRDVELLTHKRGLTMVTMECLGLRSNPRENKSVIERLLAERGPKELIASGLVLPADRQRRLEQRINSQFHGKGQAGKIPKAERRNQNDKVRWGWTEPVLIPYFDEKGDVLALRPHKGGAPGATAAGGKALYIPRAGIVNKVFQRLTDGTLAAEKFETVVVTEGEFKAAALWQMVGAGSRQFGHQTFFEAVGVCAVPGISYAKHFETRETLEDWLRVVGCRRVIVAFDFEEKADLKNFPEAYEPDRRKRYDTQIYARYLATGLARKLHVRAEVCVLPHTWLNAKGKADWDGELAELLKA